MILAEVAVPEVTVATVVVVAVAAARLRLMDDINSLLEVVGW